MKKKKNTRGTRKTRKKGERINTFLSGVRRFTLSVCLIVVCAMGTLFLYDYFFPKQSTRPTTEKQDKQVTRETTAERSSSPKSRTKKQNVPPRSHVFRFPAGTEIPRLTEQRREQIIRHEGYTVSYNADYRIANWVAYELTATEAESRKAERSNKFVPDPQVKGATATNEDYTRTGYDRGHLAPAGDMKWSAKAMRESFYLSNICPQKPKLNRGIWKDLEEQCRLWAKENGALLIVTGPVVTTDMKRMGKNRVAVPKAFYKVLCYRTGNGYKGIGFLFENRDYNVPLSATGIPIDSVEHVTGIDFFPALPDAEEKIMEAKVDKAFWSF